MITLKCVSSSKCTLKTKDNSKVFKPKSKTIPVNIYGQYLHVFIGSFEEFKKEIKKTLNIEENLEFVYKVDTYTPGNAEFYSDNNGLFIIRLSKLFDFNDPYDIGIIGHEVLHAAIHILEYVGMNLNIDTSEEAYTYLLEYLLSNVLDKKGYYAVSKRGKKR